MESPAEKRHDVDRAAPSATLTSTVRSPADDHEGNGLSFRAVAPVHVRVQGMAVSVDISDRSPSRIVASMFRQRQKSKATKDILYDVSASMPASTLTAIVGGSGSGKTSMLNAMANRIHGSRLKISGECMYNGRNDLSRVRSAYVMQQDVLIPTLTVRETLRYAADLRLPPPTTAAERHRAVEEVILELGLKECANTRMGNHAHKGCSGGEKRRTSIGVQLLANPSVLFLDEPTTGLDATSAFQLVRTMKSLANKGRTVITTIHQPRSEIWGLFDRLVILTQGSPVYSGPRQECLPYFEEQGYPLPMHVNPAEHVIDVAAVDNRSPELEEASLARVTQLKTAWSQHGARKSMFEEVADDSEADEGPMERAQWAFGREISVLTARSFKVACRDPLGVLGSLIEAISMAVITGWIFFALDGSLSGIRSREGALFTAAALQGYLILLYETYRLTIDIEVFDRERGEGVSSALGFLISRRIARLPIEDLPVPLLYSAIFYFMIGFRPVASVFFTFFAIVFLSHYIAVSMATICVALSRNFAGASLAANIIYTVQSFAGGFYVQTSTIPVYMRWLKYICYVYYAFGAFAANEFTDQFYDCPDPGGEANPACKEYAGDFILDSLGFDEYWIMIPVCALLCFAVGSYVLAGLLLQLLKVELSISRARPSETDRAVGKEQMTAQSRHEELRKVDLTLDRYALNIDKRNFLRRKMEDLSILQPLTARFRSGELNVIMGPSGSGKTSLLNSMADRLQSNVATRYRPSGKLLFNGAIPSAAVFRSLCSFVEQTDDALLPSLTVRETLRFAAGLRLPQWMSREEKEKRAGQVLLKLGLKDCADNLIGNDLIKGISGGEKRRVTIAVQILTDPRVLLLDEPTSGLDAFTASSIIDVLQGLADEGRTIIMTIHQSRSDLFKRFGNVLLLARGGSPVYSGSAPGMLPYFQGLGFECPRTMNPADFAMDLITVDLQQEQREAASRSKVRSLIQSWNTEQFTQAMEMTLSTPAELGGMKRKMAPFHVAFPLLLHRGLINFRRQPPLVLGRVMQVVSLGIIIALFFAPLQNNYESVQSRVGLIQEVTSLYFVGMLQNVAIYPTEKAVFYREYADGAYSVEAFFLQYMTLEIPCEVASSLVFAVLVDLAVGIPRTVPLFFIMALNCFCIVSCGESVGIIFNTLFHHTGFAVNLTSVILSLATIMTGVLSVNVPAFLQAFNHLSPLKYSLANMAPYSLRGVAFTCDDDQRLPNGHCPIDTGVQVLDLYGLNTNPGLNLAALGIATVVYRLVSYLLLKGLEQTLPSLAEPVQPS
ncbi:MAG: hypothetical protein M1838_005725 [Thelocarpon superellum]|nr:MAG: hypothetical protein M1838_005725 [Thelocarpon superellum]